MLLFLSQQLMALANLPASDVPVEITALMTGFEQRLRTAAQQRKKILVVRRSKVENYRQRRSLSLSIPEKVLINCALPSFFG